METHETVLMTQKAFDDLPEYSMSDPTGQTIGKQWRMGWGRRDGPLIWYLCEYVESEKEGYVGILRKIIQFCPERGK